MSWVNLIWFLMASAWLTLALMPGSVWWRRREARAGLRRMLGLDNSRSGFTLIELLAAKFAF